MATILCLETATTNCSVALAVDGKSVIVKEENSKKYIHSEKLHLFIEAVFEETGISKSSIDAIAVSKGPGSYTGLRIGVSAAKGLAFALDVPIITLTTLEVLARRNTQLTDFIIPLIDARRMEVYTAVFDTNYKQLTPIRAEILTENSFSKYLKDGKCVFLGDGASKFAGITAFPAPIIMENQYPSAADMAIPAQSMYERKEFEDLAYFEPFYLKEFIPGS